MVKKTCLLLNEYFIYIRPNTKTQNLTDNILIHYDSHVDDPKEG